MKDTVTAERLGDGHEWWVYGLFVYCSTCLCVAGHEDGAKMCKPKVEETVEWGDSHVAQVETEKAWETARQLRALLDKMDEDAGR